MQNKIKMEREGDLLYFFSLLLFVMAIPVALNEVLPSQADQKHLNKSEQICKATEVFNSFFGLKSFVMTLVGTH